MDFTGIPEGNYSLPFKKGPHSVTPEIQALVP